jgi:hypothetical protein
MDKVTAWLIFLAKALKHFSVEGQLEGLALLFVLPSEVPIKLLGRPLCCDLS